MKYYVNFIDLEKKNVVENAVDGKYFDTFEQAQEFADECKKEFEELAIVLRFRKIDHIDPNTVDYVVCSKED